MKMENKVAVVVDPIVRAAQVLEVRRGGYVKALEAVPVPKGPSVDFPYASLEAAAKDAFIQLGGPEAAFKFLVKGFKTTMWRDRADKNRVVRDAVAEGETKALKPVLRAKAKKEKAAAKEAAKAEVVTEAAPQ
jgi:hypothetical protein